MYTKKTIKIYILGGVMVNFCKKRDYHMKKSFFGIASVVPALMFAACSDDGSSTPQDSNGDLISSSSSVIIPGGDSPIPGGNTTDPAVTSSSATQAPVIEPADQPISEEEKKDDGTASVGSLAIGVSGFAEVGPLVSGSKVTVSSVDAKTMTVGAVAVNAKTSSDLGAYSASGSLTSAIGSFEASGEYYNFATTEKSSVKSLKAISDLRTRKTVNINVLTHLEYDRVQNLVSQQGLSFTAAKERAEKEILAAFGFVGDSTVLFEDISIYGTTNDAANLLAITDAVQSDPSMTDNFLKYIAEDFAADGKFDSDDFKAAIGDAAFTMDVNYNQQMLSDYNNNADVMTYTGPKRNLWAAMYNLGSCTEANLNEIKPNNNPKSSFQDKAFSCKSGGWSEASAVYVKSAEVAKANGACDATTAGKLVTHTDGKQYYCRNNLWSEATADDIAAASITTPCNSSSEKAVATASGSTFICLSGAWYKTVNPAVDYSKGIAMNKKLGKGINFGNSWDAEGVGDGGWSNPIGDGDFAAAKAAGFNSVRIPVRWYPGVDAQLSGVKADIQLAINAGLTVIVNSHHHQPLYEAAAGGDFDSQLNTFKSEWTKVAQAFDSFPDDALVFEIFNEPHDMTAAQVRKLMTTGYQAIRAVSKGKTIMFEGNGYSKFAQIIRLDLPADGNIIVSGHYYEPYEFTHQGHGYDCDANADDGIAAMPDHFKRYTDSIAVYFPNATGGSVPVNLGEFGVANKGRCNSVSDSKREAWTKAVVEQANKYGMSWHYWCYKNCGGFEAGTGSSWHGNMLNVFMK